MTPASKIPKVLEENLTPHYSLNFMGQDEKESQTEIAKKALYMAQETLLLHKHENEGTLPIARFENLLPAEPTLNS